MSDKTTKKVNIELEVDTNVINNGTNPYQKAVWLAKAIDHWRIFPRVFITVYIILLYKVVVWFMELSEPNNAQAGLVSIVVGAGAAWFGLYVNTRGGKDADVQPQQVIVPPSSVTPTTTSATTTTRTPVAPSQLPEL